MFQKITSAARICGLSGAASTARITAEVKYLPRFFKAAKHPQGLRMLGGRNIQAKSLFYHHAYRVAVLGKVC